MLAFLKKLFGLTAVETPVAPYKIEAPEVKPEEFPVIKASKPTVKKATTRKPKAEGAKKASTKAKPARKPKAPKA